MIERTRTTKRCCERMTPAWQEWLMMQRIAQAAKDRVNAWPEHRRINFENTRMDLLEKSHE